MSSGRQFLVAIGVVAAAVALRLALEPWLVGRLPYITIFGGVAIAVWRGGPLWASFAALVGFVAVNALVPEHPGALGLDTPGYWIALAGFSISAGIIILFGSWTQRELSRRREAELRSSELAERLRATLTSIGDGVIVVDEEGRVDSLNLVAEGLTGWSSAEAKCQPLGQVFDIVNEETRRPVDNPALRALSEGRIVGLANHTVLRARNGAELPIDDSAAPVRLANGEIRGAVLVFRDITSRRKQDAELRQSEALLRAMYEGSGLCMGVVEVLDDGDILHLHDNAGTCRIFGVPPGGTANRRASELGAPPSLIQQWVFHYRESRERSAAVSFHYQLQGPAGLSWHRATVSPLPVGDSGRPRFSYVSEDITAQYASDRLVRQSEAKAKMALEVAQIGIWSWDPDRDVAEADARCRAIIGLSERGALRMADASILIHEADRRAAAKPLSDALKPGSNGLYAAEFRFVGRDNSVRWVVARGQLLSETDLVTDGRRLMLGSLLDITARKRAEEEVASSDRRKSESLAPLAHALRNPLAPLRNGLAILERIQGADALKRTTAMMGRQLALLVRLIDDLLDLSRINRDQLELRRETLDLVTVLQASLEVSQPTIAAQEHHLTLHLPSQPVWLLGDSARLTQLFANLLNNAAKYTPRKGNIDVTMEENDDHVVMTVADDGIGIPPQALQQVFEMFAQVDRAAPQTQGGLGIGLSLGKRLAQLHGGSLVAQSDGEGFGSRFIVTLPLVRPQRVETEEARSLVQASSSNVRVLVVDDNIDAATSLCQLLTLMGHAVQFAHDGPSALKIAEQFRPEVVFLDIGLPSMSGHEVARQLRSASWASRVKLIALSGWGQKEDRELSLQSGFDNHLVKPLGYADLESVMQGREDAGSILPA